MTRALTLLALAFGSAHAAELSVGGYASTLALGPDHELIAPGSAAALDQPLSLGLGARVGLGLTSWLDLEGEVDLGAGPATGGSALVGGVRVGPRLVARDALGRGNHLHLTAGVANLGMVPQKSTRADIDLAGHVGPGIEVALTRRAALRADARALVTAHAGRSPVPSVQTHLSLGISARFGGDEPEPAHSAVEVAQPAVVLALVATPLPIAAVVPEALPVPEAPEPTPAPLELAARVGFGFDSVALDAAALAALDQVAAQVAAHPAPCRLRLVGHADPSGPADYNLELSRRRAEAVADALVARGLAREALEVGGLGEAEPLEGAAAESRRVEIRTAP